MRAYPDTSFLFSLYLEDSNSAVADRLNLGLRPIYILTPFHDLEFSNAIELAVFRHDITSGQATAAWKDFEDDRAHWPLNPLPADVFDRGVALVRRHTAHLGMRSLDVLHVASAVGLEADIFLTFDQRQRKLARASGLRVRHSSGATKATLPPRCPNSIDLPKPARLGQYLS